MGGRSTCRELGASCCESAAERAVGQFGGPAGGRPSLAGWRLITDFGMQPTGNLALAREITDNYFRGILQVSWGE